VRAAQVLGQTVQRQNVARRLNQRVFQDALQFADVPGQEYSSRQRRASGAMVRTDRPGARAQRRRK